MKLRTAPLIIVLTHLAILLWHGAAHSHLAIGTNFWQTVFIALVIFAGPVLALVLFWTRLQQAGTALMGVAMAGSLVFGVVYHFIIAGPDNVNSMNSSGWGGMFRTTAVLLAVVEAFACGWSMWVLKGNAGQRVGLERMK
ncbi:MAG: hypothetical protein LAO78_14495 [Acidobacteriia bacterium]|nr:hypothetical protein [Terriglobia bacterium]